MSLCGPSLLQGTEDEVIDIRHGKRLHELAKLKSQPLWAEGHNHQVGMQRGNGGFGQPSVGAIFHCATIVSSGPDVKAGCTGGVCSPVCWLLNAESGNGGRLLASAEAVYEGGVARVQSALKPKTPRPAWNVSKTGGYHEHCTTTTGALAFWGRQDSGSGVAQILGYGRS